MMNKPKIRFSGYTEAWEQRKLGDEAIEMLAGGDIDKSRVVENGKYPIYANALTNDGIVGYYDDYYRVKAPAVTVTGRGDVGHAQARTVDFTPVVRLLAIRSEHDAYFLENAINNHGVIVESTGVPQLTVPQLGNYMIQFPRTIEEETKIGTYFQSLDHLITLHQRKCDQTKKLKKYMLQKMFPQNGELYPEIRFEGFTKAWEQRKFGDTFTGLQNNTLSRADLNNESGIAQNVHYGDILVKFGEYIDASRDELPYITDESIVSKFSKSFLQDGDIIIADTAEDSTVGKCSEIVGSEGKTLISGLHTMAFRPQQKFAPKFLGYYLNSSAYHNQLIPLMQGIKVTSISKSAMQDTDMIVPKSMEEQAKIGAYFSDLDNLITLHQRKCNELKEMKKYMLQNMFAM